MAFPGASSSSSSSFARRWPYDVFLSFKREDAHDSFTARLYNALCEKGIHTYMDDKLKEGEEISPAVLKAIKDSRTSIVVLSEYYASSTWCLGELMEILLCRETNQQIVLPVFYRVDPSDVRHQRESFGEAMAKHEERFMKDTVQNWKAGLSKVASLSGWHLQKGGRNESKFIHKIVGVVSRIVRRTYLNVAKYPVGIESHVHEINALLNIGMSDIRMVGIFGVGGIGKTTIAKAIYSSIAYQFKDCCFLTNVRETSKQECGLVQLQETLLSEILGNSSLKVGNVDRGINVIKERLCCKRVLLVLDDVDQLDQLETLSGERDWFGLGSRIIITTRDEHLLTKHNVDLKYRMTRLSHTAEVQLFSRHAFQSDKPNDDFVELTEHALCYAGGLPLALIVLGSYLHGRDIHHWKSALKKYKRIPEKNIHEKLKISYDGLEENEKNIFLDIACFFKGADVEYVIEILDGCGFFPDIGIAVLMDKSLINISGGKLVMHDLLQDMGKEIVRQESLGEPGKRSRLWFHEDVRYVLEENMGTNKIEGILVELPKQDLICWSSKTLEKMKGLRLFITRNAHFSERPNSLPNELRVLDWTECPLQSFPSNFHGQKLIVLRMHNGLFKEPKEGFKTFQNLRNMVFSQCKFLTEIPDISRIPNLKELRISKCRSLVKVHDSVGSLEKLTVLSFVGCSDLTSLPRRLKLSSLNYLDLPSCLKLHSFPEIEFKMECLRELTLFDTAIKELPSSIGYLSGLRRLNLRGCKNLMRLPNSILQLQHLVELSLENCSNLVEFPTMVRIERQSMPSIVSTKESEISSSRELFSLSPLANSSILDNGCTSIGFPALRIFELQHCRLSKSNFLVTLDCFFTLEKLNLSGSDIVSLPACIKRFVRLRSLLLVDCKQLQEILELPPNIEEIFARGCVSLESFPLVSKEYQFNTCELHELYWIDLSECYKLMLVNNENQVAYSLLDKVHFNDYFRGGIVFPGNTIPCWFSHRKENSYSTYCFIDINGLLHLDGIRGIAFCVVFGPILGISPNLKYAPGSFRIENKITGIDSRQREFQLVGSDHVWLEYFVLESSEPKEDNLRVGFYIDQYSLFIKSCGVHLIHKHGENGKDHSGVINVDFNFRFKEPKEVSVNTPYSAYLNGLDELDEFERSARYF